MEKSEQASSELSAGGIRRCCSAIRAGARRVPLGVGKHCWKIEVGDDLARGVICLGNANTIYDAADDVAERVESGTRKTCDKSWCLKQSKNLLDNSNVVGVSCGPELPLQYGLLFRAPALPSPGLTSSPTSLASSTRGLLLCCTLTP